MLQTAIIIRDARISRKVLEEIRKSSNEIEVIEYLKKVPFVKELKILLAKLNLKPLQIVRTAKIYSRKNLKGRISLMRSGYRFCMKTPY